MKLKRNLIIPIHPPKFSYLINAFSGSFSRERPSDVFLTLVTTTEIEKEMFQNYMLISGFSLPLKYEVVSATHICEAFDLEKTKEHTLINKDGGVVNFKKMSAILRSMSLGFDETICIDSDVVFFSNIDDCFERARSNFAKRKVIAGHSVMAGPIVLDSSKFLKDEDKIKIDKIYDGGKLFSWFYDAPFYPANETKKWLKYLEEKFGSIDNAFSSMFWGTFEHLIFQMYCILHLNFDLIDVRHLTGERVLEEIWMSEILRVIDATEYVPVWANLGGFLSHLSEEELVKARTLFLMGMHVDRVPARFD